MNYGQKTMQPIKRSQFKTKINVSDTSKISNESFKSQIDHRILFEL